ncbi:hypothetical protein Pmani_010598 [Petrolisthes manimaculis]|uniref:Uncharacterized protein n=1 Tax=Petrolisthes manimaculis TaxID=1843537 RepID=A0AAE1Q1U0_9EUCA|nr:hypothetical protein Pmani_010598 [Petrolisthes manimaculis]
MLDTVVCDTERRKEQERVCEVGKGLVRQWDEEETKCVTECSVEERYTRQTNMPADKSNEGDKLRDSEEEGCGNMNS